MIPIFIKCSHRAFYLDRLLQSIELNVSGRAEVVLLNDGIKEKYIAKLLARYPYLVEQKSGNCREEGEVVSERLDPSTFWVEEISKARAEHVLILEEDTWLTSGFDLQDAAKNIPKNSVLALFMSFMEDEQGSHAGRQIYARQRWARGVEVEFYNVVLSSDLDGYLLFGLAHGIYSRDYWVAAYTGIPSWLKEFAIIRNAVKYLNALQHSGTDFTLCKTARRIIRQSGLTTGRKDSGGPAFQVKLDWNLYNEALNDAWLEGDFDSMAGFPSDYPLSAIEKVLRDRLGDEACERWSQWRQHYVEMYRKFPGHLAPPG